MRFFYFPLSSGPRAIRNGDASSPCSSRTSRRGGGGQRRRRTASAVAATTSDAELPVLLTEADAVTVVAAAAATIGDLVDAPVVADGEVAGERLQRARESSRAPSTGTGRPRTCSCCWRRESRGRRPAAVLELGLQHAANLCRQWWRCRGRGWSGNGDPGTSRGNCRPERALRNNRN